MKISTLFWAIGIICASLALLGGCRPNASEIGMSPQQRAQQTTGDKSIPAPAQALAAQQDQRKNQMDSMRSADAKAVH